MRVTVTRPLPESERTAAALRSKGHNVLLAPLMQIETIAHDLAGTWSGVIFTSANAVRALTDAEKMDLGNLPAFVVGHRTRDVAHEAGFDNVISAGGDGRNLADLIVARRPHASAQAPLLYLAGKDRAFDLEGELRRLGIAAKTVAVYRAATAPFPETLIDALRDGHIDAVLHFSRRSAENYVAGARGAGIADSAWAPQHLCLSAQVAEPL